MSQTIQEKNKALVLDAFDTLKQTSPQYGIDKMGRHLKIAEPL